MNTTNEQIIVPCKYGCGRTVKAVISEFVSESRARKLAACGKCYAGMLKLGYYADEQPKREVRKTHPDA